MKQVVVLLPMKGHSERVPNKNMKDFNGSPLYHTILKTLQQSLRIKKIIINTDSEIIADDATSHFEKVYINPRPDMLCGDFVPMNDIIAYDLSTHVDDDHFLQTHSTNPLLSVKTIDKSIELYFDALDKGYDSVYSVTKFQSRFYWENGKAINHNPAELIRTQDLSPIYEENSNFYIFSRNSFNNANKKRIGLKPLMCEVNKKEAIDIDDLDDFIIAEAMAKIINNLII